ncbi:MAG: DUF4920 domain-containing protein [Polyangia bacterium]
MKPEAAAAAKPEAAAAAKPEAAAAPTAAAAPAATAPGKFGAALSAAPALPCQTVLADAGKYDDKDVKLTGRVSGVCAKKGCWMSLTTNEPGAPSVRVTFKDYGFFVPTDSMGKTAVVEGRFKVKTLSVAEAQHYADDATKAGQPAPRKVTEPQREYSIVATGVEML